MVRVTVDSNVLRGDLERIRQASNGMDVEIVPTTVTLREHGALDDPQAGVLPETVVYDESLYDSGAVHGGSPVYESFTLGESRLGMAVLAGDDSPPRLEAILAIVSDGSFPKPGQRVSLTHGERRQLRDAMILEAHAREGRDVFVTNDRRGFVGKDGEKRRRLEDLCRTRIRTVEEFCAATVTGSYISDLAEVTGMSANAVDARLAAGRMKLSPGQAEELSKRQEDRTWKWFEVAAREGDYSNALSRLDVGLVANGLLELDDKYGLTDGEVRTLLREHWASVDAPRDAIEELIALFQREGTLTIYRGHSATTRGEGSHGPSAKRKRAGSLTASARERSRWSARPLMKKSLPSGARQSTPPTFSDTSSNARKTRSSSTRKPFVMSANSGIGTSVGPVPEPMGIARKLRVFATPPGGLFPPVFRVTMWTCGPPGG